MLYSDFLAQDPSCPFCSPRLSADRIITKNHDAFLTVPLAPYRPDDLMIIPFQHVCELLKVPEHPLKSIYQLVETAVDLIHKKGHTDYSLLTRFGPTTGSSIAHLHAFVLPGDSIDRAHLPSSGREVLSPEELHARIQSFKELL